jgi:hypothetical protein
MGFTAIVFPRSFLSLPLKFPVALDNKPSQKDKKISILPPCTEYKWLFKTGDYSSFTQRLSRY